LYRCGFCGADFSTEQEAAGHMMKHISEQAAKQEQALAQTYLLMAASQLTQICLMTGRKPDEAMEVFTRAYELLKNWHSGVKGTNDFTRWLEQQWKDKGSDGKLGL
jgi:hypothetical protein